MKTTDSIQHLVTALLQANIPNPTKDAYNPHHKNNFASLGSYLSAIKEPLRQQGLIVIQSITGEGRNLGVETMLAHESGEYIITSITAETAMAKKDKETGTVAVMPADGQAIGSLTTYLRRYAIGALLNIVGEDDDDAETERKATSHNAAPAPSYSAPSALARPATPARPANAPSAGGYASVPVNFGKHKGKTLGEVFATDRDWVAWAAKRELKNAPDGKPYRSDIQFTEACLALLGTAAQPHQTSDDVPF